MTQQGDVHFETHVAGRRERARIREQAGGGGASGRRTVFMFLLLKKAEEVYNNNNATNAITSPRCFLQLFISHLQQVGATSYLLLRLSPVSTMVQCQLCTLDHLRDSRFGRPYPRHGLQLLFWFANRCVTFELVDYVDTMMMAPDCKPETGCYGFHLFGNIEELLPVLKRPKKNKKKTQVLYFEVGNLNKEASANLPSYVRENYDQCCNRNSYNLDRIIISYQVRTRVVEAVYITEHDPAAFGMFIPDRTHGISCELMRALQMPPLDISTFLIQMGYYVYYSWDSSAQQVNALQTYSYPCSYRTHETSSDLNNSGFYTVNVTPYNSGQLAWDYGDVYKERKSFWEFTWEMVYKGFEEVAKKRKEGGGGGGGGATFLKVLLAAGALCLAAKCFSCFLSSSSDTAVDENVLTVNVSLQKMLPWRILPQKSPHHVHTMLDYVY